MRSTSTARCSTVRGAFRREPRAIARAQAAGVEVVLATGRRYEFARAIFEQLPAPLTLILSNGAIVKTLEGHTLMRQLLPRATARAVLARTPHHRDTAAVVFDRPRDRQVVFETIDWEHPRHRRYFKSTAPFLGEHRPLEDALTEDPVQVMFTGGCAEMRTLFDCCAGRPTGRVSDCRGQRLLGRVDRVRGARLFAGRRRGSRVFERVGTPYWARARGITAGRGDGDRRQPQRPRDARVRRPRGRHGQRARGIAMPWLGGDRFER